VRIFFLRINLPRYKPDPSFDSGGVSNQLKTGDFLYGNFFALIIEVLGKIN